MSLSPATRVTFTTAAGRRRTLGWRHAVSPARSLPLAATLAVGILGMALVGGGTVGRMGSTARGLASGEIRDLNAIHSARELEPALLDVIPEPGHRRAVAERIFAELPAGGGKRPLANVGALAAIRVPAGSPADPWLTSEQLRDLKPAFVVRTPGGFQLAFLMSALLFVVACVAMHVAAHAGGRLGDPLLLPAAQLLASLGFIALTGLRDPLRDQMLFERFSQGMALGAVGFVGASLVAYERSVLRRLSLIPLLGALALSAALVVLGHGPSGSDAKVNLFGIQPIEVIRLLLVLFLAGWFAERWQMLRELHEPAVGDSPWRRMLRLPRRQHALPPAIGVALALAFFFLQRDLGPALVLLALFLCLYSVSRAGWMVALAGLAAIGGALAVAHVLHFPATVGLRTAMWLSPWENGLARGDQIAHALWGFAAGGLSGTGLGLGMPALVPAAHTDLILATVGEELGFVGVLACVTLFAVLVVRGLRIALRAPDVYTLFLALGLTLGIALQTLLIAGGVLGLAPLSGVGVPFLSYGRSALLLNFVGLGILWSISAAAAERSESAARPKSPVRPAPAPRVVPLPGASPGAAFAGPVRVLAMVLAAAAGAVVLKAGWVQFARADETLSRGQLARQADGELRYQYNPRLLAMAELLPRGDIFDRNGVLLASSRWSAIEQRREEYRQLGVDLDRVCSRKDPRHYPFGGAMYHALGDWVSRRNWGASNTAFLERDQGDYLSGYEDRAQVATVFDPVARERRRVVRRDLAELVPLWRHRYEPRHRDVVALTRRNRDVRTTLDVRLQLRAQRVLASHLRSGVERGAVVVMDAARGNVLASVSWPSPDGPLRGRDRLAPASAADTAADPHESPLFDRARFGLYPPGSTFKLVTAAAALEQNPSLASARYECRDLQGGRVGAVVGGRLVRDDATDHAHGAVNLERGMIVSCNAYFAQLGRRVGWPALADMAHRFGISVGDPTPAERPANLIEASFGQAQVVASPFRMARVAATIANAGQAPGGHWISTPRDTEPTAVVMSAATARTIGAYMRGVVTQGTAQRLAGLTPPIAGKTGTAQVAGKSPHSWFVGYAPSDPTGSRLAFAVLIENGGAGVRAALVAGEVVAAARDLGLLNQGGSR